MTSTRDATLDMDSDTSQLKNKQPLVYCGDSLRVGTTRMTNRVVDKNAETDTINSQERVIEKVKVLLNFLQDVQITNEESLAKLDKPLDDLLSSLKYLPVETSFDVLPVEIKTNILSYLCDSGAFIAASVCQEWQSILKRRLDRLDYDEIRIGKCCSSKLNRVASCENGLCFLPEETLKASMILKLDIPLCICYPLTDIDSSLIAKSLTSGPSLSIVKDCQCKDDDFAKGHPILTQNQIKELMTELDKNAATVTSMVLEGVDMTHLDQDEVVNCLLKIESLSLSQQLVPVPSEEYDQQYFTPQPMLDMQIFVKKLREDSRDTTLNCLFLDAMILDSIELPEEFFINLADALCKVKAVYLEDNISMAPVTIELLIEKILGKNAKIKTLSIMENTDWLDLISPENLKALINTLDSIDIWGVFTSEHVEAAKSIHGVNVTSHYDKENYENIFRIAKW